LIDLIEVDVGDNGQLELVVELEEEVVEEGERDG